MPTAGRRGVIAGGIIALVLVAFGVFVLPFAFPTPPPIITRFVATRAFSPGTEAGRSQAVVAIRLSEPSNVSITIQDPEDGTVLAQLTDGNRVVRSRTLAVRWDGTDPSGRRVPDGVYAVDLKARAGEKRFAKSRKLVVDTTAPRPRVTVESASLACRTTVSAPGEPVTVRFAVTGTQVTAGPRTLGARGTTTWNWRGRDTDGDLVPPGLQVIEVTARDDRGNTFSDARTCWVGHLVARPVPAAPSSGGQVGVAVQGAGDPQVTLTLRQRLGSPGGRADQAVLGDQLGYSVTGPASTARITIPDRTRPADVWLLAAVGSDRQALIGFRGRG